MPWKKRIIRTAAFFDGHIDRLKFNLFKQLGMNKPLQIVPYRTYGTIENFHIRGRVLADKSLPKSDIGDSGWKNLINMYRRFESDEVPGAVVQLTIGDIQYETVSDNEGYFHFDKLSAAPLAPDLLYYSFPLTTAAGSADEPVNASAEVLIPPAHAEYGIISDIDDTIIQTGATSLLQMGKTVLLANARTRLPFEGVSAFYAALQQGNTGTRSNPFFYVSSSPWNLYDLITDFMDINDIPQGPLMLRDFGIRSETFVNKDYLGHKFKAIEHILETYPHLPFILIGDSGEEDPVIYTEVVKKFPSRIKAIYIREINHSEKTTIARKQAEYLLTHNVDMILSPHSAIALQHARQKEFIP
jgi:phosphatidate phosphatase APP1